MSGNSKIKIHVCNDMVNNPFWEVRLSKEDGGRLEIETKDAIDLAQSVQPRVDKIEIGRGSRRTDEIMFRKMKDGVIGWERVVLSTGPTIDDLSRSVIWKSCRDLGVKEYE